MAAEQQPAASWGADTDGRLNQSSEHLTEHAMLSTDASGNTVLVGGDGAVFATPPKGFASADAGNMIFVRDHAYQQIIGGAGFDSQHQWFKNHGLDVYSLTINTTTDDIHADGHPASPGGRAGLTWGQVKQLESDGVEITNHTNRHVGSLARANTGFTLVYTGANATATAYVVSTTGLDRVLHCVDASDNTFDLTNASYDTLAELKIGVDALAGWSMTLADELDGSELSKYTLGVAVGNAKNCKTTPARFAISSGLVIRYKGSKLRTAYARIRGDGSSLGLYLQLLGDGVVLAELAFSSGSYDTLAKLSAYVNGTAFGADTAGTWECNYLDNEGVTGTSYTTGVEATRYTLGGLAFTPWVDVAGTHGYFCCGMPIQAVLAKMLMKAKTAASGHSVTMKNVSDVGGPFVTSIVPILSDYNNMARVTGIDNQVWPKPMPVDMSWVVPACGADDNTTTISADCLVAGVRAAADSPGFVVSPFLHQVDVDGSSGLTFIDYDSTAGVGYQAEAKVQAMLTQIGIEKTAGRLNLFTQQSFYEMRQSLAKPSNRLFNPRLINSGETMTGIASASLGDKIPGWSLATPNATSFTVSDGVLTVALDTASASNYLAQTVYLEPGKTYEIGAMVESLAYSSGTGVSITCLPSTGVGAREYRNQLDGIGGVINSDYAISSSKMLRSLITIPPLSRKAAYIRNAYNAWDDDSAKTWDLSSLKHIKLNINAIGVLEIDCSAGADSAAACYAYEIAAAINAALKSSATYKAYGEYHNIARSENGYLVLESPYASSWLTTSTLIAVTAGTTTDATNKIFGGQVSADRPLGFAGTGSPSGMIHPYIYTITLNAIGTYKVSGLHIMEIESFA